MIALNNHLIITTENVISVWYFKFSYNFIFFNNLLANIQILTAHEGDG